MSATDPAEPNEYPLSLHERISAIGAVPLIDDLSDPLAGAILHRQFINLVGSPGGAIGRTLIYRPGDPTPGNGVFADWNLLMNAFASTQGNVTIIVDDSIVSPAVIPAGAHDLEFRGTISGMIKPTVTPVNIQFVDGATLLGAVEFFLNLEIETISTTPVITMTSGQTILFDRGANPIANGAAPFIEVPAGLGATPIIIMNRTAHFQFGVVASLNLSGAASVQTVSFDFSGFDTDSISGDAASFLLEVAVGTSAIVQNTQAAFLGTEFTILTSQATLMTYTPAVVGDWSGVPPANVSDALDRIAAAVGPIP